MPTTLSPNRLIRVSINLTPKGAQAQNQTQALLLGPSAIIDVVTRMRSYQSLTGVGADFPSNSPEYLAAALWFEQVPQPTSLNIGRWAKTAAAGQLVGGVLGPSVLASLEAIAAGGFTVTVDGGAAQHLNTLNFTGISNLNGAATIINAVLAGATCAYDASNNRFVFTSATTGAASVVTVLSAPTAGTDASAILGGTVASGAYQANGIAAESALSCFQLFDLDYGQQFYGFSVLGAVNADYVALANYIQGTDNKHTQWTTTQEPAALNPLGVDTTSLPFLLSQINGLTRTWCQYSSTNPYAGVSAMARLLTVDYNGNSTTITLMYKQEPGIVPENLNVNQVNALESKNCNVFVAYDNDTAIIEPAVMASGDFADDITNCDWFATAVQTALYNALYTTPTKIPQTDAGTHVLVTTIEAECSQGVTNGMVAPGTWNSAGFGALSTGDFMAKGFYVYAPPVASQAEAARATRVSVPIQVAVKLAGAIHTVDVAITVNR